MSIPANKADNKTPAYDIKLKRTQKTSTDDSIKDGILEYGEPLFNKADSTLSIGDGTSTVANTKVTKLVKKEKADTVTYYSAQSNGLVTLQRETATDDTKPETENIYPKIKYWTKPDDTTGISKDEDGNIIKLDFSTSANWEWYNSELSSWVPLSAKPTTSNVPARQTIAVKGVLASDRVCISLCLSAADIISVQSTKDAEKVFGTITNVESYDGGIIVYCKKVREDKKCYLNVFGG